MKYFFPTLVFVSALALAGTAAYYSVYGISKLFSAQMTAVMIMAGILEFCKLIAASYLHRMWKRVGAVIKSYLIAAVAVLMIVTSAGIYGFLVSAYQDTKNAFTKEVKQIELLEVKENFVEKQIEQIELQVGNRTNRNSDLTGVRSQQETRIDSLYIRKEYWAARKAEAYVKELDTQVQDNQAEINDFNDQIVNLQDSLSSLAMAKIDYANSDVAAEIGPLKYVADLTDYDMDKVVNWFVLLFILVFDPLAITLLISAQIAFKQPPDDMFEAETVADIKFDEEIPQDEPEDAATIIEPKENLIQKWKESGHLDGLKGGLMKLPNWMKKSKPVQTITEGITEEKLESDFTGNIQSNFKSASVKDAAKKFLNEKEEKVEEQPVISQKKIYPKMIS